MLTWLRSNRSTLAVAAVTALIVGAGPAAAGKFLTKKKALKLFYTKAQLQAGDGTINQPTDPVNWTKLQGVPAGFADGADDTGGGGPATDLTCTACVGEGELDFDPANQGELDSHKTSADHDSRYWKLDGNALTGTEFVGSTNDQALDFHVNDVRAFRLEPHATSPNVIGGFSGNNVTAMVFGATISGGGQSGSLNRVTDNFGSIGGGWNNQAGNNDGILTNATSATIGGGQFNVSSGLSSTIGGGASNQATGPNATVGGGVLNTATMDNATVGGGAGNDATAQNATIAGGNSQDATANFSTLGGGQANDATGTWSTVAGGLTNVASDDGATVGGGRSNLAAAEYATIGGGGPSNLMVLSTRNRVTDDYGTIGGGGNNQAGSDDMILTNATYATVAGGRQNTASGSTATIAGGFGNTASGSLSTVGGGNANTASGGGATVPGGTTNSASAFNSFAAGNQAKADDAGAFVWADNTAADIFSPGANSFTIRAAGRIFLEDDSTIDDQSGFINTDTLGYLSTTGVWTDNSSREVKENFSPVDGRRILDTVADLPITTWNYEGQDASIQHIGPVAEDFHAAFGVGESPKHLASLDTGGVALAAIQGLNQRVDDLEGRGAEGSGSVPGPTVVLWQVLAVLGLALGIALTGRRVHPEPVR